MHSYTGSITTSGTSEAIRFEKALFRQHPEFRRQARVRASIIAPGRLLVSLEEGIEDSQSEEDPLLAAFLAFLENDIATHPERLSALSAASIEEALLLTEGVQVDDNDDIPDTISF